MRFVNSGSKIMELVRSEKPNLAYQYISLQPGAVPGDKAQGAIFASIKTDFRLLSRYLAV